MAARSARREEPHCASPANNCRTERRSDRSNEGTKPCLSGVPAAALAFVAAAGHCRCGLLRPPHMGQVPRSLLADLSPLSAARTWTPSLPSRSSPGPEAHRSVLVTRSTLDPIPSVSLRPIVLCLLVPVASLQQPWTAGALRVRVRGNPRRQVLKVPRPRRRPTSAARLPGGAGAPSAQARQGRLWRSWGSLAPPDTPASRQGFAFPGAPQCRTMIYPVASCAGPWPPRAAAAGLGDEREVSP